MNKSLIPLLLALALAPLSLAHGEGEQHLYVEAYDDDGYYFKVGGYDGKNPTIVLQPAVFYNITFVNRGSAPTDFRFEDGDRQQFPVVDGGRIATFGVFVPNAGATEYWSTTFQNEGMAGRVVSSEEALETPIPPVALLAAGLFVMTKLRRN